MKTDLVPQSAEKSQAAHLVFLHRRGQSAVDVGPPAAERHISSIEAERARRRGILLALRQRVRQFERKLTTHTGYGSWNAHSAAEEIEDLFAIPSSLTLRFFQQEEEMAVFRVMHDHAPSRWDHLHWFKLYKGPHLP